MKFLQEQTAGYQPQYRFVTALLLLLFGFMPYKAWAQSPNSVGASGPALALPINLTAAANSTAVFPVTYTSNGNAIAIITFSVDFDQSCLVLDVTDSNQDGTPDAITFTVPAAFNASASVNLNDTDSEIDFFIRDLAPPLATLPSAELAKITFKSRAACQGAAPFVNFSAAPHASFGSTTGVSVQGTTTDGSLLIQPGVALQSGWNLIALPVAPSNPAPVNTLAGVSGSYNLVYGYNGCTGSGQWQKFNPSGPPFANTLTTLSSTQGLWVRAANAATLYVSGAPPVNTAITLCVGWNLISYPAAAATPIATALAGIVGKYNLVYAYDSSSGNPWQKYNPTGPAFANTLTTMKKGVGYWIRVTQATTLIVP